MAKKGEILDIQILDLGAPKSAPYRAEHKERRIPIGKRDGEPLTIPEIAVEKTDIDFDSNDFHSFGKDNLFAEGLAAIGRQAINHRSILSWKAIYTAGKGFTGDDTLIDWTKNVNGDNENFRGVFKKVIKDYNEFGNAFVEIVTDPSNTFFFMFHHDMTNIRLGKDKRQGFVGIFPDWSQVQGRKSKIIWIPLFKDQGLEAGEDGLLHTFVHIRDYEAQFPNYGLPVWVAGMNAAGIGHKTNKWNISRLDNQFEASGILELYGDFADKELKEKIDKFKKGRTGEGRNAQLLIITRNRGGDPTVYTPLIQTNEGDWINLHKQSDQDMVMAHNWFRSLSGLQEPGKLGSDTQQIRTQYEIALSTVIPDTQEIILSDLNQVFTELGGFNTDVFKVINTSPVSLAERIDVNLLLTRKEGYKIFDIEHDENDKDLDRTIKVNTSTPDEPRPAD